MFLAIKMLRIMKSVASYQKKADKASLEDAYTKVAYHTQRARWHLDQISTQNLADDIELTKQALQYRINQHKKEVANNGR